MKHLNTVEKCLNEALCRHIGKMLDVLFSQEYDEAAFERFKTGLEKAIKIYDKLSAEIDEL